jgi:hypothetical protein
MKNVGLEINTLCSVTNGLEFRGIKGRTVGQYLYRPGAIHLRIRQGFHNLKKAIGIVCGQFTAIGQLVFWRRPDEAA